MSSRVFKYGKCKKNEKFKEENKMFENENNNGFVIGGDLDLGSASSDFGGFTSIDACNNRHPLG